MIIINHPARTIPGREYFDNKTQRFFRTKDVNIPPIYLKLEHSLMSMSKWECKWHKPFAYDTMNDEELLDYIRCMNINPMDQTDVYRYLSQKDFSNIFAYMADPCTAWTDPRKDKKKPKKQQNKTVEEIYYAMIQLGIPPEYEKWHINRLIALIEYFDYKGDNMPGGGKGGVKKRTEKEILNAYHELNQKNRKKYKSKG